MCLPRMTVLFIFRLFHCRSWAFMIVASVLLRVPLVQFAVVAVLHFL